VIYLNPLASIGGAERALLDVMASVREAAPEVQPCLIVPAPGTLAEASVTLGFETRVVPQPEAIAAMGDSALAGGGLAAALRFTGKSVTAAIALRRYVRELGHLVRSLLPDLVHTNGNKLHLVSRLLEVRKPVVWHLHDYPGLRPVLAHGLRWAARRTSAAIAVSRSVGEDARRAFPDLPITVVHNAVDSRRFAPGAGDGPLLDRLAGLAPGPFVRVGLVATYARWKGHELFLEAAAQAARLRPDLRFFIVGGPIYRTAGSQVNEADLRERARSLGIADRVGFVGFQIDLTPIYRALDICVHASTQPEPFGLAIVEAMACGRAVIVSREGGAAEVFADEEDAVAFEPRDPASLAGAIVALAGDPERRRRLGEQARLRVVARFSRERLGREVLAVYRQALLTSA
jgi:glycosyltransferase involved in cell wall biosynthesis